MQRSRSIAISGDSASGLTKWRLGSMKRERPGPQPNVMSCSGHSPPLSQTEKAIVSGSGLGTGRSLHEHGVGIGRLLARPRVGRPRRLDVGLELVAELR